jgi:hypothetical protein
MTERQQAIKFLELLQQQSYRNDAGLYGVVLRHFLGPSCSPNDLEALYGERRGVVDNGAEGYFSPFETDLNKETIWRIRDKMLQIAPAALINDMDKVVFGVLPTGQMNATAISTPKGGRIIAFNQGIFGFIYLFSKLASQYLPTSKDGDYISISTEPLALKESVLSSSTANNRFLELLVAYLILGDPYCASWYKIDEDQSFCYYLFLTTMELFIFSHELGHITCGHLDDNQKTRDMNIGNVRVNAIKNNWDQEYAADWFSLNYVLAYNINRLHIDLALAYVGVELFFTMIEVVYEAQGTTTAESHPPSNDRKLMLRKFMAEAFADKFHGAAQLCDQINDLVLEIWNHNKERYMNAKSEIRDACLTGADDALIVIKRYLPEFL